MTDPEITTLLERWRAAEVAGDVDALAALSDDGLRLVGPFGFVLDREAWLQRYRGGDLVTRSLTLDAAVTRVLGDTAITVATWRQQASHQGDPADGEFRVTAIWTRGDEDRAWRLGGIALSQLVAAAAQAPIPA